MCREGESRYEVLGWGVFFILMFRSNTYAVVRDRDWPKRKPKRKGRRDSQAAQGLAVLV